MLDHDPRRPPDGPSRPATARACAAPAQGPQGPSPARPCATRGTLPGSHALPPHERIDLTGPKVPAPGEPDHRPAGDPERAWRKRGRWHAAAICPDQWEATGRGLLARHDAAALLDTFLAVAEWASLAPDGEVRAFAARMIEAGEALARGDTDRDGRAVPLGRILGLQPPGGKTAAYGLKLTRRDDLLRRVREAVPAWRDAAPRSAAALMAESFTRYRAGAWRADRERETAPPVQPAATWWRVLRLGLAVPMPGADRLAAILAE